MQLQPQPGIWIFFLMTVVLSSYPASMAQSYSSPPANITKVPGESVSFVCGVSPSRANMSLNFTLYSSQSISTLRCPSDKPSQPSQVINGYCEVKEQELRAVWCFTSITVNDNGTYVVCQSTHLPSAYGFLTIHDNKSYFAVFIGCVMGGFFGFIIVFGLAFIALKRSERFQKCFKGRTPQDDITTIVEGRSKSDCK